MISCSKHTTKTDISKEKKAILELHKKQREYHFLKDSIAFANQLSDNFISVNKGEITNPKREAIITRYHRYFSSVEFLEWDDVSEPIIKFSDDGTMAYTIVDKMVKVSFVNQDGDTIQGKTHFAWTAIYKKYGNQWKIDNVTSTDKKQEI
ncbi:nuclear transport factor 2 family protein [Pseudotenacibaculum sp. MALMAid0570]|uniref:nuclear transport factor 2 family protein n=1 Tax=Pseudotenacibaculum sp. MALMAid0570 TaxID=3143938 RepID=UPI0032DFEA0E